MKPSGFTLVELIVTIGLIGILFAVVLIAIDPAQRFAEARNATRHADVTSILSAVIQYQHANRGNWPSGLDALPGSGQVLGTNAAGCSTTCTATRTESACLDLTSTLVDLYLAEIPADSGTGTSGNTDYFIDKTTRGLLVVGACDPELAETIQVKR